MRVLYVNHGALVSGAERSLLELLQGLPPQVSAEVACPGSGPLAAALGSLSVPVRSLPSTEGSFRLHPVHTARMIFDLARMARSLRRHVRTGGFEIVHANSIRAGLVSALAFGSRRVRRRPLVVVHVRDSLPKSPVGTAVRRLIAATADHVIAISAYTAANFGGARTVVVHNPVDVDRFTPVGAVAGFAGQGPLLGIAGQITPWKGQDDAIRALALLEHPARLLVVGEAKFVSEATRYDNRAYERSLHELAAGLAVTFTGEREDMPDVMRACDLVLVPSWEEPFGRVIIEAMACGKPVIATNQGGPPEIVTDGVDGRLLPPQSPALWAQVIDELLAEDARREAMGAAGRERAVSAFSRDEHVRRVLAIYRTQSSTRVRG